MFRKFTVKMLTLQAMLAALSIILTRFCQIPINESLRISFGNIPVLLSGLLGGPLAGALVGAVADIIGCIFFNPFGWYPPLTLSPFIYGIIAGLFARAFISRQSYVKCLIAALVCNACSTMTVSTVILANMQGLPSPLPLLALRIPLYIGITVCEALALYLIYKSKILRKAGISK